MKWRNQSLGGWGAALPVGTLFLCAGRWLWLVRTYSVNVFIGDQWFYNEPTLFHRQSAWGIFRWQSGPWRQGLGGLLNAWIGPLTHWNSRDESFIAAWVVIAGCVLALWLKIRVAGELTPWDSMIPMFALSPVGFQTVVGVTHYSHGPLPFVLVIAFCLAWTVRRYALKYALVVAIAFVCTYTGFGIFIGPLCPLVIAFDLWARRVDIDKQDRAFGYAAFIVSLVSLASFLLGFKFSDGVCPPYLFTDPVTGLKVSFPNPFHYFFFVAFMFANYVGLKAPIALVPSILAGSMIFALIIGGMVAAVRSNPQNVVPAVLIAYSLLFALGTALGRMCLGLGASLGSRYMIYLAPSFIGMYLLALSIKDRVPRYALLATLLAVALASSLNVHRLDRDEMAEFRRQREAWKQCYLGEHNLHDCNRKIGATPYWYPDTIQEQIDFVERNRLNFNADSVGKR
jgi:hypothetical protein